MKFKRAYLATFLVVTGCASLTTPYQPPGNEEPAATLTVRNASPNAVTLWPYADAARCTGLLQVKSTFNMAPGSETEIRVLAGKDFSIGSLQRGPGVGTTCSTDSTFHPEPGSRYVAIYTADSSRCLIQIARQVTGAGGPSEVAEPSFRPRKTIAPLAGTAYCE